jgi:uncharacterized membrane protein
MDLEIPYWHPIVVHFPIALIAFGAAAALVYAVAGRAFWRGMALYAFAVGAVGAWVANVTGETIYEDVEGTPVVEALIDQHRTYGEWTLWLSVATVLMLVGATWWMRRAGQAGRARDPLAWRLAVLALALAAAVLVGLAGHLGGTMVWGVPTS